MRTSTSYGAFHRPRLVAGVGLRTGTLIWVAPITIGMMFGSLWAILTFAAMAAILHLSVAWAFDKDHKLFEAYALYARMADHYDVGMTVEPDPISPRPKGYGRGIQC